MLPFESPWPVGPLINSLVYPVHCDKEVPLSKCGLAFLSVSVDRWRSSGDYKAGLCHSNSWQTGRAPCVKYRHANLAHALLGPYPWHRCEECFHVAGLPRKAVGDYKGEVMVRVGWGGETTEKQMGGGALFAWPVGIGLIIDSPEPPPPCCKLHPVSTPRLAPCACWPLGITANSWYTDTLATEMTPHLANFEFCNHRFLFFLTLIIHNFCLYLSLHSPRHVLNPTPPPTPLLVFAFMYPTPSSSASLSHSRLIMETGTMLLVWGFTTHRARSEEREG